MNNIKIAVIGLGYVGLPLARLFATKYPVVGFDINKHRVAELMTGLDSTLEVDEQTLKSALLDYNPTTNRFLSSSKDNPTITNNSDKSISFSPPSGRLGGASNHDAYDIEFIQRHAKLIVDMRNMVKESSESVYKL